MVLVDISGVLGRRPLLGGAHSSWSVVDISVLVFSVDGHFSVEPIHHGRWLTSLVFSVDGHFSVEPIRHGRG